jgi:hypothetical protein
MQSNKTNYKIIIIICCILPIIIGGCSWVVWFPDIYSKEKKIISILETPSGEKIYVRQWWNGVDFYSVDLLHIDDKLNKHYCLLDPDSKKLWCCKLTLDVSNVIINGDLEKFGVYNIKTFKLLRNNGIEIIADNNHQMPRNGENW